MKTATPRTDAAMVWLAYGESKYDSQDYDKLVELCEQLEKELAAATENATAMRHDVWTAEGIAQKLNEQVAVAKDSLELLCAVTRCTCSPSPRAKRCAVCKARSAITILTTASPE